MVNSSIDSRFLLDKSMLTSQTTDEQLLSKATNQQNDGLPPPTIYRKLDKVIKIDMDSSKTERPEWVVCKYFLRFLKVSSFCVMILRSVLESRITWKLTGSLPLDLWSMITLIRCPEKPKCADLLLHQFLWIRFDQWILTDDHCRIPIRLFHRD